MRIHATYMGTATLLLEIGSLRILTDPVLNPKPTRSYSAGFGLTYHRQDDQALPHDGLGSLDAVLLSHDHHGDNLDEAGRELLPSVGRVLTTVPGARRLGGNALGLRPFESHELEAADGFRVKVTATPARHGPPLSLPITGTVIGFVLEWPGQEHGALYVSGDTVFYRGIRRIADRFKIGTAVLHAGCASFRPLRIPFDVTLTSKGAVRATQTLDPHTVIPVHFEGWSHFRQGREAIGSAFEAAGLSDRLTWLPRGQAYDLEV